jgi:hypothetical protein
MVWDSFIEFNKGFPKAVATAPAFSSPSYSLICDNQDARAKSGIGQSAGTVAVLSCIERGKSLNQLIVREKELVAETWYLRLSITVFLPMT